MHRFINSGGISYELVANCMGGSGKPYGRGGGISYGHLVANCMAK